MYRRVIISVFYCSLGEQVDLSDVSIHVVGALMKVTDSPKPFSNYFRRYM